MSDNLKNLLNSFKTPDELRAYIEAQQQSLIDVSKKVKKLEKEKEELEKKLKKLESSENVTASNIQISGQMTNEEAICIVQLSNLRTISDERSLTFEETKKADVLIKLLQSLQSKDKKKNELEEVDTETLLKLIKND